MGERGNGEGSISRRKNGGWMAQYAVYTAEGRKRRTIYGKTRVEVAKKRRSSRGHSRTGRAVSSSTTRALLSKNTWSGG
jgi:integrase